MRERDPGQSPALCVFQSWEALRGRLGIVSDSPPSGTSGDFYTLRLQHHFDRLAPIFAGRVGEPGHKHRSMPDPVAAAGRQLALEIGVEAACAAVRLDEGDPDREDCLTLAARVFGDDFERALDEAPDQTFATVMPMDGLSVEDDVFDPARAARPASLVPA